MRTWSSRAATALLLLLAAPAARAQTDALVVIREGQSVPLPGGGTGTVGVLNPPFVNGENEVGFTGSITAPAADNFLWFNTGIVWLNSMAAPDTILTGAEFTMGVGNNGEFVYSPTIDGDDGVWTDRGYLLGEVNAPGVGGDTLVTFNSRPRMRPNGQAYWVAGLNNGAGGTASVARVFYTSPDRTTGSTVPVLRTGQVVGGFPIQQPAGIAFDYDISDNGAHHIHALLMQTGSSTTDDAIYVDGAIVARASLPAPGGAGNWTTFDTPSINNSGNYVFVGDTDAATNADEVMVYNNTLALREGNVVSGVTLGSTNIGHALNNIGFVLFGWSLTSTSDEGLFVGPANNLAMSTLVLRTNDSLDTNGDNATDYYVRNLNSSTTTPGIDFADGVYAFVEVVLEPVGNPTGDVDAIIRLDVSPYVPVELIAFTGTADGAAALLEWETASETNNAGFEVQHLQGQEWTPLAFVEGHGTTTEAQAYRYRVPGLAPGTHTFRLRQVDYDGTAAFSPEVEVEIGLPGPFALSPAYPNPFNPQTRFTLSLAQTQRVTVEVLDALGRRVATLHEGALTGGQAHTFTFEGGALASGAYVVRALGEGFVATQPVMLLK